MRLLVALLYAVISAAYVFEAAQSGRMFHWSMAAIWGIGAIMWIGAAYLHRKTRLFRERADRFLG